MKIECQICHGDHPTELHPKPMTLWVWNTKWMKVEERGFIPIELASFQLDRTLVATGMIHSRAETQRLIKAGSVSWRKDDSMMDWAKVIDWKLELKEGWPWVLRVGSGHWRSVMVEERPNLNKPPVSKPRSFPGLMTVMRPKLGEEAQDIEVWSELWR
jgi:hypothetical protein